MRKLIFITKADRNGNRLCLSVDPIAKTYRREFNLWVHGSDAVELSKRKELDKLIGDLHANGYTAENDRIHIGTGEGGAL